MPSKLRLYRLMAGLSQAQLATLAGFQARAYKDLAPRISQYESGVRNPSVRDAHKIIGALKSRGVEVTIEQVWPPEENQAA